MTLKHFCYNNIIEFFITAYEAAPGLLYPATLTSMFSNINFRYQKGEQQQSTENHLSPTAAFQFQPC